MKKITIIILFVVGISLHFVLANKDIMYKKIFPTNYSQYVEKYSTKYKLDKYLVYSIIKAESKFDPNALSKKGAKGLMQLSDITARWASTELELKYYNIYDPETNIMFGCWYLNKLEKQFKNIDLVIAAYNGGSGNVRKWLNNSNFSKDGKKLDVIPFKETENYTEKVIKNYKKYLEIYEKNN